jgi:hypothetical protein
MMPVVRSSRWAQVDDLGLYEVGFVSSGRTPSTVREGNVLRLWSLLESEMRLDSISNESMQGKMAKCGGLVKAKCKCPSKTSVAPKKFGRFSPHATQRSMRSQSLICIHS